MQMLYATQLVDRNEKSLEQLTFLWSEIKNLYKAAVKEPRAPSPRQKKDLRRSELFRSYHHTSDTIDNSASIPFDDSRL